MKYLLYNCTTMIEERKEYDDVYMEQSNLGLSFRVEEIVVVSTDGKRPESMLDITFSREEVMSALMLRVPKESLSQDILPGQMAVVVFSKNHLANPKVIKNT